MEPLKFTYDDALLSTTFSYKAYRERIAEELSKPPADAAAEKMRPYTEIASNIMDRYEASAAITEQLQTAVQQAPSTTWLVITEGWCGDAAFNMPLMAALEKEMPGKVKIRIALRDSNPDLIDAHLTDGGRSIPIVIVLDNKLQEIAKWGPRPNALQALTKEWKSEGLGLKDLIKNSHAWYHADKTASLQQELLELVKSYANN